LPLTKISAQLVTFIFLQLLKDLAMKSMSFLLACLYILLSAGCEIMPDNHLPITVTENHNNGQVHVAKGNTLTVRLLGQGGTGYGWELKSYDRVQLSFLGGPATESDGDALLGGSTYEVFRFRAQNAGTSDLEIQYLRPWEKETPPAKVYRLTVHVTGRGK
jgi:inhibitor of cysteine peptidase